MSISVNGPRGTGRCGFMTTLHSPRNDSRNNQHPRPHRILVALVGTRDALQQEGARADREAISLGTGPSAMAAGDVLAALRIAIAPSPASSPCVVDVRVRPGLPSTRLPRTGYPSRVVSRYTWL
jgi:hypothetical protein